MTIREIERIDKGKDLLKDIEDLKNRKQKFIDLYNQYKTAGFKVKNLVYDYDSMFRFSFLNEWFYDHELQEKVFNLCLQDLDNRIAGKQKEFDEL